MIEGRDVVFRTSAILNSLFEMIFLRGD